uniref:Transmembrane serine protease 2 gene 2 n=1 Tax=Xenopus tropicalis TaxID=8364 RepID=A0A803JM54_XENTR
MDSNMYVIPPSNNDSEHPAPPAYEAVIYTIPAKPAPPPYSAQVHVDQFGTGHPIRSSSCTCTKKICVISIIAVVVLVAIGIVVPTLIWYFVTAPPSKPSCPIYCHYDYACVLPYQICDGVKDCTFGEDEENCVRLYGADSQLQVYSTLKSAWLPVCADNWNDTYGRFACQDFGFNG